VLISRQRFTDEFLMIKPPNHSAMLRINHDVNVTSIALILLTRYSLPLDAGVVA